MAKQLLNERMLALAGITHPQIMGFVSNSPRINENADIESMSDEQLNTLLSDYESHNMDAEADQIRDILASRSGGGDVDASIPDMDDMGDYDSFDDELYESDTLTLDDYESAKSSPDFNSDEWEYDSAEGGVFRKLSEGEIPGNVKNELTDMFGQLKPSELDKLYRLYQEDPDYVMSGEVDDALFRDSDVGGYGQEMPDDPGNYGDLEGEEEFMMEGSSMSIEQFYKSVANADDFGKDGEDLIIMAQKGKYGPEIQKAVQDDYSETARDIGAHEDDDFEDIYGAMMHKIESAKYGPLNEQTVREILGMTKKTTVFKAHPKNLISERMMGFAGIAYPQAMGLSTNAPNVDNTAFKKTINEIQSDLTRNELYQKLPMIHSSMIMELAERYLSSNSGGKSWGAVVEELTEEYFSNSEAKKAINITLSSTGLR